MESSKHESWMQIALEEASRGGSKGEVPVGAVAVFEDRLIAADHNRCLELTDPTAHAEIIVLRRTASLIGNYRLQGLILYVTLEPCCMCAGAMILARISQLIFSAWDPKSGAVASKVSLLEKGLFNHFIPCTGGISEKRSQELLKDFFQQRRI